MMSVVRRKSWVGLLIFRLERKNCAKTQDGYPFGVARVEYSARLVIACKLLATG